MKREILFILFASLALPTFGATLEDLIGVDRAAGLRAAPEPLTEVQLKNSRTEGTRPRLLPRYRELELAITGIQNSLEPNILVEVLSLYRKPASTELTSQTGLLNQLTALSTLTGIEYYSESRKAMRTFYESSRVIDNPDAKNPLPDPVFTALPASVTLYARQKDLTFGDNIYRYDYSTAADAVFFVQENITAMNAGIIPAIGKNKFRSLIAVIDTGDSYLIYAAAMAKAVSIPGMSDRIGASFTNRAKAVLKWFEDQYRIR